MTPCSSCGAQNPTGFRFCGSCGAELAGIPCLSCGFDNPPGQRFCGQCGSALGEAAPAPAAAGAGAAGERKLATVLFADVVGFTSMAENTDPEAVARTVDAAFRRMAEVVAEHGGTVDKYMGDSLMAVFGVPLAHDDDAERAVAAALAMRELGGDLAFSIGINTGEVMVTSMGRDGEATVIGDAVNVAARLEKAAGGGEVLVGRVTADLAGERVVLRERQPVVLKGKRDPVEVWEAIALRRDAVAGGEQLPLVGREDELAFLLAQWRRLLRDRRSAVVLVTGEAGIGKTRLVEELSAAVEGEALVARARYPAYGRLGGPQVAAEVAEQLGPMGEADVDVRVKSVAGELDPSLKPLDPNAVQQEQLWAFRRYLESKAEERPLLIAIDDMHRSGEQTINLLGELMARVDAPIMLAMVGRPQGGWLSRFPSATTVRLGALSPSDGADLVGVLACDLQLPEGNVQALVDRAAGNPLYLRELVAVLRSCAEGPDALTLPPTLQAILAARLDALRPEEKAALQRVALLADAATDEQVEALGLAGAASALGSLVGEGLLHQRGDGCYEVADPLLREVAYETLPRQVRGEWHRRAAADTDDAVDRARHLERAVEYLPDDPAVAEEAAGALSSAGITLLDSYRVNDGLTLLLRAVELGAREPEAVMRLASTLGNAGRSDEAVAVMARLDEADLTAEQRAERAHIEALVPMFNQPEAAIAPLEAVARQWAELGNRAKEGWALSNLGVALFNSGRMAEAATALERSIPLFVEAGETNGKLAAQSFLALVRPDDPRVSTWLEEALRHCELTGDRTGQAGALILLAWHHAFRSHLGGRADVSDAEDCATRARALATELGFHDFELHSLCLGAVFCRLTGRLEEARRLVDDAQRVPRMEGSGVAILVQGVSFLVAAADDPAAPTPEFPGSSDPVAWMGWLAQVEGMLLAGRVDEVAQLFTASGQLPTIGALTGMLVGLPHALGLVLLDRHAEARPALLEALASAQAVRAEPGAQAARALLAEVEARAGNAEQAWQLLEEAAGAAPDGIAGALAMRARAALGDEAAPGELAAAARVLAAPGLLAGMGTP